MTTSEPSEVDRKLEAVLVWMRKHRVQVRFSAYHDMLFAPKPNTWPQEIRELVSDIEVRLRLARLLAPRSRVKTMGPPPPGWIISSLKPCYGCRRSCAARDPLGHARHPWCGWLNQRSEVEPPRAAPRYPGGRRQPPNYKGAS